MPCTEGGVPVTIDRLFGLVNVGTTARAWKAEPSRSSRAMTGARPVAAALSR